MPQNVTVTAGALLMISAASATVHAQTTCSEVSIVSPAPPAAGAQTAASCSGCDDDGVATITFTFDRAVPCGTFVDGSPWIVDDGTGVNVIDISPAVTDDCGSGTCNGWMIDVASRGQAFDSRNNFTSDTAPAIRNPSASNPFVARAGNAVVKSVSFQDEIVGADCRATDVLGSEPRHCLYFVGVLSVLGEAPPDGTGAGYFRPPWVGTARPMIAVSDARLDRLPRLPVSGVEGLPDRARAEGVLCLPAIEHMGTYRQQFLKGYLNVGGARGYHGYVSQSLGDHLLRALFEDRTDRMAACLVQRGIDMHHMLLPPVETSWGPNGGHGQGRTMWPYLAAALLERDDWKATMDAMARNRFAERSQVYWSPVADPDGARNGPGEVLYGSHPGAGGSSMCTTNEYFGRCYPEWPGSCNRICADPFGYIDGGSPGTSYQQIFTPAAQAFVLTAHLVPDVAAFWPMDDGHQLMLEYTDRWVECGEWTAPDPCDADDPLDPSSPSDCTSGPIGTCICRPGSGRYVDRHCTPPEGGGYGTDFTDNMWNAFRACARDCSCEGMSGLCEPPPAMTDAGAPSAEDGGGTTEDGGASSGDGGRTNGDGGAGPPAESGCGCRAMDADRSPGALWPLLGLVLFLTTRRRPGRTDVTG